MPYSRPRSATRFRDRACQLLTVLGDAGVGKSRLVREFTSGLAGDATVLRGRCLPYGEGITYWPLAEIVREITRADGLDPASSPRRRSRRMLAGEEKAELIAERVAEALGLGGGAGARDERGDLLGRPQSCSRRSREQGRSSSSWTTSTGPSRRSST